MLLFYASLLVTLFAYDLSIDPNSLNVKIT